jgi:hypothetical protein
MGSQANATKIRGCKSCGEEFYIDADGLVEHARICKRAKEIGLVLAKIVVPQPGQLIVR